MAPVSTAPLDGVLRTAATPPRAMGGLHTVDAVRFPRAAGPARPGVVARERLVRRLLEARDVPVVLLAAPAGYGKTTLVSQWVDRDPRVVATLTLDEGDNDPRSLLAALALALDADPAETTLPRLVASLGSRERPLVLVLDDAHVLRTPASRRVLTALAHAAGAGLQLALVSRSDAVLPVGRLRMQGGLLELGARDLAMTPDEAALLLHRHGVAVSRERAVAFTRRTEGWPAGLALAALAAREQPDDASQQAPDLAGEDRAVAAYVKEELLAGLAPRDLEFLTRTSILDELSAPRCDAILGREDSAEVLGRLAGANVLLVPLDRRRSAYRYHGLYAEVLRAELRRREPGREAGLHARASAWCAAHGEADGAIDHAVEAGDVARASRLLWDRVLGHAAPARRRIVARRLERLGSEQLLRHPRLALAGAGTALVGGDLFEAERLTLVAGGAAAADETVRADVALLEAAIGRCGAAEMGAKAAHAHELMDEAGPWRPMCRYLQGVALHLVGRPQDAVPVLREAAHRATASAPMVQVLSLAQLALIAAGEGDLQRGAALAGRACAQVHRTGLDLCPPVALALAVSAELRVEAGDVAHATSERRQALGLLRRIVDPSPWYDVACRVALARTTLRLGRPTAAAELLAGTDRALARVPDAVVLRDALEAAAAEVDRALRSGAGAEWALTAAEMRVLRHLPSHLSFPDIADRLYVSPNTVKTHARGIYRKLGVSSRGAAVELARGAGLLDHLEVA